MARPLHLPNYFQKVDFKTLYKIHGQKKKGIRLLALSYVQEGRSVKETASLLFKTEYTVREWIHLYDEGGVDGLLSIRPGRGRKAKLSPAAEFRLKEEITNLTGSLKGGRLRAEDIRELIREKFKVEYGLSGIYPLLHRLGYSWITARSIHPKADKDLQESFKK
jgi:transposase